MSGGDIVRTTLWPWRVALAEAGLGPEVDEWTAQACALAECWASLTPELYQEAMDTMAHNARAILEGYARAKSLAIGVQTIQATAQGPRPGW